MDIKLCIRCNSTESAKWYTGPCCQQCYHKNRYNAHKDRILSSQDPERKRACARARYKRKRREILKKAKNEYQKNREQRLIKQKAYYDAHKAERIQYQVKNEAKRIKVDVNFKLRKRLRSRLKMAMKGNYRSGLAISNLGCSIEEFRLHVEALFQAGMSWGNYGKAWELDHISPLFKFNLTDAGQVKKACHFSNIQPLWKQDHYQKTRKDRA
jgi:predicted NAD/FAD-binding protein